MSIAKEAVELYGGTITVDSEVGKGSTFIVQIPVTSREAVVLAPTSSQTMADPKRELWLSKDLLKHWV